MAKRQKLEMNLKSAVDVEALKKHDRTFAFSCVRTDENGKNEQTAMFSSAIDVEVLKKHDRTFAFSCERIGKVDRR